jgi:hypothetical protein
MAGAKYEVTANIRKKTTSISPIRERRNTIKKNETHKQNSQSSISNSRQFMSNRIPPQERQAREVDVLENII